MHDPEGAGACLRQGERRYLLRPGSLLQVAAGARPAARFEALHGMAASPGPEPVARVAAGLLLGRVPGGGRRQHGCLPGGDLAGRVRVPGRGAAGAFLAAGAPSPAGRRVRRLFLGVVPLPCRPADPRHPGGCTIAPPGPSGSDLQRAAPGRPHPHERHQLRQRPVAVPQSPARGRRAAAVLLDVPPGAAHERHDGPPHRQH